MYRLSVAAFAWAGASRVSSSSAPATAAATARTSAGPRSWASPSAELGLLVLLRDDDNGSSGVGAPASFPPQPPVQRGDVAPSGCVISQPSPAAAPPAARRRALARLPEEVDDLDERVVEPVGEGEDHDDPEEHRDHRGALGATGVLGAVVSVHRHVGHDWLPVVIVLGMGEAVAGSPSRAKRSSCSPTAAPSASWKRSSTGRIMRLAMKPTTRTPTMMKSEIV